MVDRQCWAESAKEDVLNTVDSISNPVVKSQAKAVLSELIRALQTRELSLGRLPKPKFTAKSDGSGVLEWGFGQFQTGISFEIDKTKSYWYYLFRDDSIGAMTYISREISKNPSITIAKMAEFVVNKMQQPQYIAGV
jgi:hypothetical protein